MYCSSNLAAQIWENANTTVNNKSSSTNVPVTPLVYSKGRNDSQFSYWAYTGTKRIPESRFFCAFFLKHKDNFPSCGSFVRYKLCALDPYLNASLHLLDADGVQRWVFCCNMGTFEPRFTHLFSRNKELHSDL